MPAAYAHYRFGREVLPSLPRDVQRCIRRFRPVFDMGLQGPDIFFYHSPILGGPAGSLGHTYHNQTGQELFTRVSTLATSEAARAYLYGLLGHYCLDSVCHPFVERMEKEKQIRHVALESEFDRYLMALDHIPHPAAYDMRPHLKLTRGECVTVAGFYPPATPGIINRSVKNMGRYLRFLSGRKRRRVEGILKAIRPRLLDHLIPTAPVEGFARLDSELLARFNHALADYPGMLRRLTALMQDSQPLGSDFEATFG